MLRWPMCNTEEAFESVDAVCSQKQYMLWFVATSDINNNFQSIKNFFSFHSQYDEENKGSRDVKHGTKEIQCDEKKTSNCVN